MGMIWLLSHYVLYTKISQGVKKDNSKNSASSDEQLHKLKLYLNILPGC